MKLRIAKKVIFGSRWKAGIAYNDRTWRTALARLSRSKRFTDPVKLGLPPDEGGEMWIGMTRKVWLHKTARAGMAVTSICRDVPVHRGRRHWNATK